MHEFTLARNPYAVRDFRLLWAGEALAAIVALLAVSSAAVRNIGLEPFTDAAADSTVAPPDAPSAEPAPA